MKWQNSVQVFIDPYIKQNNKDLTEKAQLLSQAAGYFATSEASALKSLLTSKIIIFEQENLINRSLLQDPRNFLIQLDQPNLDLFSSQELLSDAFTTCDEVELENHFEMISIFLRNDLEEIEKEVITSGRQKISLILNNKEGEKPLAPDLKRHFEQFEKELFEFYSIQELINHFNLHVQSLFKTKMSIKSLGDILLRNTESEFTSIFNSGEKKLFLCWQKHFVKDDEVRLVFRLLERCLNNHAIVYDSIENREFWERRLSQFDLPIVIFDESSEIMTHNRHFVDLNISSKQCLDFEHNEQITLGRSIFRVLKNLDLKPYLQVIFVPVNEFLVQSDKPSFEELGIISSSIAHELNNPLAGISAALDVLLLDEFSFETTEELREMKKVVHRCRNLVTTFLGFSQMKTASDKKVITNFSIESVFDQALELIRFRLIENNMTLKIDFKKRHQFQGSCDSSVLTMMIYLSLGEMMTKISHHNLVAGQQQKKIDLKIIEHKSHIEICFPDGVQLEQSFYNSKLVSHLFDLLQLKAVVDQSILKFTL